MDNLWITIGMLIAWPRVGMGLALVAIGMPLVTLAHLLQGVRMAWGAYGVSCPPIIDWQPLEDLQTTIGLAYV